MRAVALAVACVALLSSNASAASWAAPSVVAPAAPTGTGVSWAPVVAADGTGNLTAIWAGEGASGFGVYAASRSVALTGPWSTPVRIAATPAPRDLRLAVNAKGQAVAGWFDAFPNLTQRVVTVTRTAAGVWAAPTAFSATAVEYSGHELQIDPAGRALGVWATDTSFGSITQASGAAPALDGAGPASSTSAEQGAPFDLAIDAAGRATVIYIDSTGLGLYSATRKNGEPWQAPQLVERWTPPSNSDSGALARPQLAVNGSGQAAAVWVRGADAGTGLQAATRSAAGTWSASTALASIVTSPVTSQRFVTTAGVGIDAAGNATAAWDLIGFDLALNGDVKYWTEVRSRSTATPGAWSAVEIRGERRQATFSQNDDPEADVPDVPVFTGVNVAVGSAGPAAITWLTRIGDATTLQAAVRGGNAWDPATDLATLDALEIDDATLVSSLAVDAAGRATAVWADGRRVLSRSAALVNVPAEPGPADPGSGDPEPTTPDPADPEPATPGPPSTSTPDPGPGPGPSSPGPASPAPAAPGSPQSAAQPAKLVVAMYLVPSGKRCPAAANGTVGKIRTPLKVKASKIRGKLRCRVTGTIPLGPAVKAGSSVTVLVTAKGVKRKTVSFAATR